ncbi:aspartyl protease [Candidatus Korarchaeum cryptofilum]|jgi:clan AA aspartic protease|uniref:Aspartyl protease n=1 Tax=Candidatus Korarchaeum cryptofilum TaxID=498846 RepID=A0A3R9P9Q0_9CREN|nr:aspartyl protease family protein [Candidatus Korarchaeum cryptofilum]RSN68215.1 aspartyl protease [Candidatus Korarchaeum cryptofilum]
MDHIWVKVRIGRPDGTKYVDTDALVDTGATLTVIPRSLASELDLQVTGKTYVETAAGRIEQDRSRAFIEIEGRSEIVPVLVSDVDKVLIGVTMLEVLGLRVDPVTGKLVEWTILMF